MGNWVWLIYIVIIGGFIYLMMIRPNQKRAAEQKNMMDAIQPGARVMLTSGLFGTVQAVGDKQMVVELAPGMAVTVVKPAVAKVVTEAEEEFEYADEHEQIEGTASEPNAIEMAAEEETPKPDEAPDFEPPADEAKPAPGTQSKK
ncbi:MAG: preprotein translocase subunit YajC [Propionibacteriaceae bacterium]|nr:preprotein translocase subunit YajC [Propionibacteriaceae bacterium]